LTLTNGVATLPDEALTSCLWNSSIDDPSDVTVAQAQSFVQEWFDFVQPRDNWQIQINWYTVRGDTDFHYLAANEEYDPSSGSTLSLELTIPSVPAVPASASATVDANALRGAVHSQAATVAA
jgi:hypothetical protein